MSTTSIVEDLLQQRRAQSTATAIPSAEPSLTSILTHLPPIIDDLETETSLCQNETLDVCLPLLRDHLLPLDIYKLDTSTNGACRLPPLKRAIHVTFARRNLLNRPGQHQQHLQQQQHGSSGTKGKAKPKLHPTPYDPSRPWMCYWSLIALSILGEDVGGFARGVTETLNAGQNSGSAAASLMDAAANADTTGNISSGSSSSSSSSSKRGGNSSSSSSGNNNNNDIFGQGGYGGGHGQASHGATSYAAVLSLCMVYAASLESAASDETREAGREAIESIDRRGLWKWLGQVKQPDGGFRIAIGGEQDVRGAYCFMVIISLLRLPLELPPDAPARAAGLTHFTDGLPQYLSRCQTYEGGISGAPQTEAHGAYAFCVLACLCILGPPEVMIPMYLDLPLLIAWLSARQYAPEGGFSGRTNKLVDGCYSHWVGGCWPFIETVLHSQAKASAMSLLLLSSSPSSSEQEITRPQLYSREGLAEYVMCCCQTETGGFRDKPGARPDAYHTCYTLSGLSAAVHSVEYDAASIPDTQTPVPSLEQSSPSLSQPEHAKAALDLNAAYRWKPGSSASRATQTTTATQTPSFATTVTDPATHGTSTEDLAAHLHSLHPVFVVPWSTVQRTRAYFLAKTGF